LTVEDRAVSFHLLRVLSVPVAMFQHETEAAVRLLTFFRKILL